MTKFRFFLWLGIATFCQTALSQSYDVRPKFIQGQLTTHKDTQRIEVTSDFFPGNVMTFDVDSEFSQLVKEVRKDGSVDLVITFLASKMAATTETPQRMDFSQILNVPILIELNGSHQVKKISTEAELSKEAREDFRRFKQFYYNMAPEAYAPDHLVAMGESWENQQTFSFEMFGSVFDQVDSSTSTLKAEQETMDRDGLLIDFEGTFEGTMSENLTGVISGTYQGERTIEKETGQDLHFKIQINQKMDSTTENGNVTVDIKIQMERKLVSETSVSVR